VGIKTYMVGKGITLDPATVRSEVAFLFQRVPDVDRRAVAKFGLPTVGPYTMPSAEQSEAAVAPAPPWAAGGLPAPAGT
jgi:hypothetical protein